jgi:excisionase family DNA binding protein
MNTATQSSIHGVIDNLAKEIRQGLSRPIYLRVMQKPKGEIEIKQIEFLTAEHLAELAHVDKRTVYSWIEKANENGLKFYRAPGTRGVLFEINEVLEWIKNTV